MRDESPLAEVFVAKPLALDMYRRMLMIRRFEETVVERINEGEIPGNSHEYIGQEAVAVGTCLALHAKDGITSTHRGHGHMVARANDVARPMAELYGRVDGTNRGRGGSMHMADLSLGIFGANGIVGAGTPIGAGVALAFKRRNPGGVVVSFFGDGAINQGVVYETLNMAALWRLPVVFLCENNLYSVSTALKDVVAIEDLTERARACGMPSISANGMDVQEVYSIVSWAVRRARQDEGPTFVECKTYRYSEHSMSEIPLKLQYRDQEEVEAWRKRDPILTWAQRLSADEVWTEEERTTIDLEVEGLMEAAVEFARNSPWPDPQTALEGMYVVEYPGTPEWGPHK